MRTTQEIGDDLFDGMRELSVAVVGRPIPAPELYVILGNLEAAGGYNLAELLGRLAIGLERSLDEYNVYEDDGADPSHRVRLTKALLRRAASHAQQITLCLEAAHCEIAGQGHHGRAVVAGGS
ncbi:MAG TPA: hypothetical protein VN133_05095 [Humibacter sp.]|nr:hypothetical protein [Humibacter sp.]